MKKYFIDNKIGFFTNSFNPELLEMSTSFYKNITDEILIIPGIINGNQRFYGYACFNYVLSNLEITNKYDYLIYIDEDCFITDLNEMFNLIKYFIDNNYDFCGMPDGGVISHRCHNPISINTFFTIFNVKHIKEIYDTNKVKLTTYESSLNAFIPNHLIKTTIPQPESKHCDIVRSSGQKPYDMIFDNYEPYYKIFFYLLLNGCKPLYLNANDSNFDEGITTELLFNKPFAYHTWYARNYSSDHHERINHIYNECIKIKKAIN